MDYSLIVYFFSFYAISGIWLHNIMDDVLMMGEGTLENMQSLAQNLLLYRKSIGMVTNIDKSSLALNKASEYFSAKDYIRGIFFSQPF